MWTNSFVINNKLLITLVVRFYRTPPEYNAELAHMVQSLCKYAVIIHLGFGFWMFSNPDIVQYQSDFAGTNVVGSQIGAIGQTPVSGRLSNPHSVIIFVAWIFMIAVYLLWFLLSRFFCCKKLEEAQTEKDYEEQISFKEIKKEFTQTQIDLADVGSNNPELTNILTQKLVRLGNILKGSFAKYDDAKDLAESDPQTIKKSHLKTFIHKHDIDLSDRGLKGLYSYRMMVKY